MGQDVAFVLAVGMTVVFALTNGFHDAASAIATLVATRIARPLPAVLMAAAFNLLGPLFIGGAVADVIGKLVDVPADRAVAVIGAGISGAVVWNLFTWWRGLPSSSSHALIGGLMGAALLEAGAAAVTWGPLDERGHPAGVFGALIAMLVATILGFGLALFLERIGLRIFRRATYRVGGVIRPVQWLTSAWLAFSHGSNDAQKAVGIISALLLATGRTSTLGAPLWATFAVALVLTIGTALGGWRIVRTLGRRIFPLHSLDGLVSQTSSAAVIVGATLLGAPVSTSQIVSSSIVGIGVGRRRWRHVGWDIVGDIGVAWLITIPGSALLGAASLPLWKFIAG